MIPEKDRIDEFVKRMREAAAANLESVILYGSAVAGDYRPDFSNLNLFCVLQDSSFTSLKTLAPVSRWWGDQKQPAPLFMTRRELQSSNDVFTIELLDMQQHHRVLFGEDVLAGLQIPMDLHRVQVEYELREKLLLLRQKFLLHSEDSQRLWELLVRSVSSFATLFRHACIALGMPAPAGKREAVDALSRRLGFDGTVIHQVLDVREDKLKSRKLNVNDLFAHYLSVIEQVTAAVDEALGTDEPSSRS